MLSKSSKYAIKAVIYLAHQSDEEHKILVKDMHEKVKVSESYLAKLLQELARHGIVSSTKGRRGGFYITEENKKRSLMDIVKVIDGEEGVNSCILGISNCDMENPCPLHHLVGPGKTAFNKVLEQTSLKDLTDQLPEQEPFFPL